MKVNVNDLRGEMLPVSRPAWLNRLPSKTELDNAIRLRRLDARENQESLLHYLSVSATHCRKVFRSLQLVLLAIRELLAARAMLAILRLRAYRGWLLRPECNASFRPK